MALIALAKPDDRWTIPHPIVRIAEAQFLNGNQAEGLQTFRLAAKVIAALPIEQQNDHFWNAILIKSRTSGRTVGRDLTTAYRNFLEHAEPIFGPRFSLLRRNQTLALEGRFAEALDAIQRSPEFQGKDQPGLAPQAYVDLAGSLLPSDPPGLIDSTLAEARQAVLNEADSSFDKFNHLIELIAAMAKLNRFDAADELGGHLADIVPTNNPLRDSNRFNISLSYSNLAEQETKASQSERAKRSARQALDSMRDIEGRGLRYQPLRTAIIAMIAAGDEAEALRCFESLPQDISTIRIGEEVVPTLKKRGKPDEARRWTDFSLVQIRRWLNETSAAEPRDDQRLAELARLEKQYVKLNDGTSPTLREVEALPVAEREALLKGLAREWTEQGRVAEALGLVNQTGDPQLRRAIEIAVATNLPVPAQPPAAQSPRSDAAR